MAWALAYTCCLWALCVHALSQLLWAASHPLQRGGPKRKVVPCSGGLLAVRSRLGAGCRCRYIYSKYLDHLQGKPVRLLEIGLGCNMGDEYGAGRSFKVGCCSQEQSERCPAALPACRCIARCLSHQWYASRALVGWWNSSTATPAGALAALQAWKHYFPQGQISFLDNNRSCMEGWRERIEATGGHVSPSFDATCA